MGTPLTKYAPIHICICGSGGRYFEQSAGGLMLTSLKPPPEGRKSKTHSFFHSISVTRVFHIQYFLQAFCLYLFTLLKYIYIYIRTVCSLCLLIHWIQLYIILNRGSVIEKTNIDTVKRGTATNMEIVCSVCDYV